MSSFLFAAPSLQTLWNNSAASPSPTPHPPDHWGQTGGTPGRDEDQICAPPAKNKHHVSRINTFYHVHCTNIITHTNTHRSNFPLNESRECTPNSELTSRAFKNKTVEHQFSTASRLLSSSRPAGKRNMALLRPIEHPKTPGLVPIDDGIRGHRLCTASTLTHPSPPSTPFVKNTTQLPPLDTSQYEKSPPVMRHSPPTLTKNSAHRNRVTFSTRIVSAADQSAGDSPWKHSRTSGTAELRFVSCFCCT